MNTKKMANRRVATKVASTSGSKHMSFDSPASQGASKGSGMMAGAGELPAIGPGAAARRVSPVNTENPTAQAASNARPAGMKTYNKE